MTTLASCRCGPRTNSRFFAFDAARPKQKKASDPTGTLPLQQRFKKDVDARWAKLRVVVPSLIVARTNLVSTIEHHAATGQDSVKAFQSVLDRAIKMIVTGDGRWMARYVREAGDQALLRAGSVARVGDAEFDEDKHPRDKDGKWTHGIGELDEAVEHGLPTAALDRNAPVHLRVGTWDPNNPVSKNYAKGDIESGLSVYELDKNGQPKIPEDGEWAEQDLNDRMKSGQPKFLVQGEVVGRGHDGEPLLSTPRVIGKYKKLRVRDAAPTTVDRIPPLQSLAVTELQGIAEAASQQAVRAYAEGLLLRKTPAQIARDVQAIIDKTGRQRSDMLVSFIIVKAFSVATLDAFRARGITHVGIDPEHVASPPVVTDAKAKTKAKAKKPSVVFPSRKVTRAENKLRKKYGKQQVEVQTAEDDRVCPICIEIAENGPYSLDEAEGLIPAHIRCRCSYTVAHSVHDASTTFDPDQHPRDAHGKFAPVGGLKSWMPPATDAEWASVQGQDHSIDEPQLPDLKQPSYQYVSKSTGELKTYQPADLRLSSGVIMREPDGRVWLVKPTKGFGGYDYTFPKGGVEPGLHPQANAIKEVYEETGLKARITGFAGDYRGDTSVTRMYHAVRETGHTKDRGWESEAVVLAHPHQVDKLLNRKRDKLIAQHHVQAVVQHDADFDEDKHPRDKSGKWTDDDLIEGSLDGWPVSALIERDIGGKTYGVHIAAYENEDGESAPDHIVQKCEELTEACQGLSPKKALQKIVKLGFIKDAHTHIAAGVMFLDPQGKALFVKRSDTGDHAGEWCFPGGAVDAGETPQGAAAREAREEVGTAPLNMEQVDRRELDGVDFTTYASHVPFIFEPTLNREHSEWVWRPLSDPPEPLHPGVRATIRSAVVGDEFNEADHPRDKDGKFAAKGSGSVHLTEKEKKFSKILEGLEIEHYVNSEGEVPSGNMFEVAAKDVQWVKTAALNENVKLTHLGELNEEGTHHGFVVEPTVRNTVPHASINMQDLTKIAGKKGSNEGGVYEDKHLGGQQYYIKTPKTKDHVQNELTAAALYKVAGVNTMEYVPVEGGAHVATVLQKLDKDNVAHFNADERHEAQKDFAVHAWLANYDAAGTGGDNQVIVNGKVATVDTGGSLKYRAQGLPKDDFGNEVVEYKSMRGLDPNIHAPDAAALYGNMTDAQLKESIARVTAIPNQTISSVVYANMPHATPLEKSQLIDKLIARKNYLAQQADKLPSAFDPEPSLSREDNKMYVALEKEMHAEPEPKTFKTKTEHIKHLLLEGTTSENLKSKMGWKAVSMPQQAATTGLKLEITKKNGVNFYKGTPIDPAEAAAIASAKVVPIKAPASVVTSAPAHPGVVSTNHDITTPAGNFKQTLEEHGVKYSTQESHVGQFVTLNDPKDVQKVLEIHKWHPKVEKLSVNEYFVAAPDNAQPLPKATIPVSTPKFDLPTEAELTKAKKNTKLTAQYVPGAPAGHPQAEALIAGFNAKYEGKDNLSPEQLKEKVNAFKQLVENMKPMQAEAQKAAAAAQEVAKAKAAAAYAKANAPPDFDTMTDEEERVYWYNKSIGSSSYMNSAQDAMHKKIVKDSGISVSEVAFIKAFTGSHSHVNAPLIAGVMSPGDAAYKEIMKDALDKMPKFDSSGGVRLSRKISLNAEQKAQYVVGQIKHWTNFSSTSTNFDVWSGNTHFVIHKAKTGVDVKSISSNPGESEVIMPADTYYTVLSVTPNTNNYGKTEHGTTRIELEEFIPYKKKKKAA